MERLPQDLALPFRLDAESGQALLHTGTQVELPVLQLELPVLHAGHLQDVVDEAQEVGARRVDSVQVPRRPLPVPQVPPGQLAGAQNGVQRGAHIVGHAAEEGLLGGLVLPGQLEGLLQQTPLLELTLLLAVHFPEAEDHLLRGQGGVKEDPHADPAVLLPKAPQELPAEVPRPLADQLADVLAGEALGEIPENLRLQDLPGGAQQVGVGACGGDPRPDVVRALDHLVGLPLIVHPVEGVVGVAQHLSRLVGPPNPPVQPQFPEGQGRHHQERYPKHQQQRPDEAPEPPQDVAVGHRDDAVPAVVHPGVVDTPALAAEVPDNRVLLQLPGLDALHQPRQVALQLLPGQLHAGGLVDKGAGPVAEEKGVLLRKVRRVKAQMLRQDVEGHDHRAVPAALGGGDYRPVIDGVGVYLGKHYLTLGLYGQVVPRRGGVVVGGVPIPGVGREDLPVQHHIGVHHAVSQHRVHPGEVHVQKGQDLLTVLSVLQTLLQRRGAEGQEGPVHVQIPLLLGGAAAGEGRGGLPGISQQRGAQQQGPHHRQHGQGGEHAKGQAHVPQQAPPAAAPVSPSHGRPPGWRPRRWCRPG